MSKLPNDKELRWIMKEIAFREVLYESRMMSADSIPEFETWFNKYKKLKVQKDQLAAIMEKLKEVCEEAEKIVEKVRELQIRGSR